MDEMWSAAWLGEKDSFKRLGPHERHELREPVCKAEDPRHRDGLRINSSLAQRDGR